MNKTIIGLTGGIASGKSTVAEIFSGHGFHIIDADVVSREVIKCGTKGYDLIKEYFPEAFETCQGDEGVDNLYEMGDGDGEIVGDAALGVPQKKIIHSGESLSAFPALNRIKLRQIVFNDTEQLKILEQIIHPLIKEKIKTDILSSNKYHILLVVPLLFETGFNSLCDKIITIASNEKTRIERLKKRDNISDGIIQKIISRQLTDDERSLRADFVIENNSTLCRLEQQVKKSIEFLALV
ncbi:MAG: dephospho-CoA kinase [Firmicutes bacterium]|nr:dephospho-CoA kinase [Bacillota bacterium]